jgi:peptidoglycan/xylan/chitin deacetylase (PgdA/CDA1 family)
MSGARVFERIRSIFQSGCAILLYHRVVTLDRDPQLLAVRPEHFNEHLDILRRKANVVSLKQLVRTLDSGLRPRSVAITFDDGYADNFLHAKPLLKQYEMPATVFVASGFVDSDQEFWWDELDRLLLQSEDSQWNVEARQDSEPRHSAYRAMHKTLRGSLSEDRLRTLRELQSRSNCGTTGRPTHRALTSDQLRQLAEKGLIEIGAHTVTHPVLSMLALREQRNEIETGKMQLEEMLGEPIHSFAYPFGGKKDYNPETVGIVRRAGFSTACSNFPGMVWENTNRFELPRMLVRDWNGEKFERVLDGIFP